MGQYVSEKRKGKENGQKGRSTVVRKSKPEVTQQQYKQTSKQASKLARTTLTGKKGEDEVAYQIFR